MSFNTISTDLHPTKQWFDYIPEMNEILNALDKRIFNLEIALQANNQILNRSHTMIDDNVLSPKITQNQISQESVHNSIDTLSQRSDQHPPLDLTLEKQLHKLNLSPPISFDQTTVLPLNLTPNQMKTRAYEFSAIFENAFDQLNIIYKSLSPNNFNRNNNQLQLNNIDLNNFNLFSSISNNSDCNPFALNLAGIFTINERDKFRYEIKYFFHILMLLFRALLLESHKDFLISINNIHNNLPSIKLIELNNRLKNSQDKIIKLSFIKKHFQTENSQQLNTLNYTKSQLKDHLIEEKYRSKIALNYCNNWKKNHILQWIQILLKIEENYTKTIYQYENILKQTEIIHQETIKILTKQNNERKLNVNKWYEYYQNETYRFERELTNFRQEFYQIKKQRQYMYDEYKRMKIIVDQYNQMKINEKFILDKQKQQEEAIKCIQTWWRGTMIRHLKQKRRKKK